MSPKHGFGVCQTRIRGVSSSPTHIMHCFEDSCSNRKYTHTYFLCKFLTLPHKLSYIFFLISSCRHDTLAHVAVDLPLEGWTTLSSSGSVRANLRYPPGRISDTLQDESLIPGQKKLKSMEVHQYLERTLCTSSVHCPSPRLSKTFIPVLDSSDNLGRHLGPDGRCPYPEEENPQNMYIFRNWSEIIDRGIQGMSSSEVELANSGRLCTSSVYCPPLRLTATPC